LVARKGRIEAVKPWQNQAAQRGQTAGAAVTQDPGSGETKNKPYIYIVKGK
jgi:hypothetical protein